MNLQSTLIYTDDCGGFIISSVADIESAHLLSDFYSTPELAKALCTLGEVEYIWTSIEVTAKCRTGMKPFVGDLLRTIQLCDYASEHCFVFTNGEWVYVHKPDLKQFLMSLEATNC